NVQKICAKVRWSFWTLKSYLSSGKSFVMAIGFISIRFHQSSVSSTRERVEVVAAWGVRPGKDGRSNQRKHGAFRESLHWSVSLRSQQKTTGGMRDRSPGAAGKGRSEDDAQENTRGAVHALGLSGYQPGEATVQKRQAHSLRSASSG